MVRGALEQIPPDSGASPPADEVTLVSPDDGDGDDCDTGGDSGDDGDTRASPPDGAVPHHKHVSQPPSASASPLTST